MISPILSLSLFLKLKKKAMSSTPYHKNNEAFCHIPKKKEKPPRGTNGFWSMQLTNNKRNTEEHIDWSITKKWQHFHLFCVVILIQERTLQAGTPISIIETRTYKCLCFFCCWLVASTKIHSSPLVVSLFFEYGRMPRCFYDTESTTLFFLNLRKRERERERDHKWLQMLERYLYDFGCCHRSFFQFPRVYLCSGYTVAFLKKCTQQRIFLIPTTSEKVGTAVFTFRTIDYYMVRRLEPVGFNSHNWDYVSLWVPLLFVGLTTDGK